MSAHTKGPWVAVIDPLSLKKRYGPPMAIVATHDGVSIDCTRSGIDYAEDCANARLIAAAPRMFAVVEAGAKAGDPECIAIVEAVNGRS